MSGQEMSAEGASNSLPLDFEVEARESNIILLPNIRLGFSDDVSRELNLRINNYDPAAPEAAHLRAHQVEAIRQFRAGLSALLNGELPPGGMAILHPTGSGKTVTTAEIIRMLCAPSMETEKPMKALMLVPGHQIKSQTVGTDDEVGALRTFVPEISVGEYSGMAKTTEATVTVMTYQALPWAVARGDIDRINPTLIVCDEAHHVIDGVWAESVAAISDQRVLLGLTATAEYSSIRNISALFPYVLARKSMKEGIEEGILAEMQGFVYRGSSRISNTRQGNDYSEEDLFAALAQSQDNYLAAKICAREVALGRRGVVSCVPGFDRAHAKIMAQILNHTTVTTPEGERNIRAAFVGGEIHPNALRETFKQYKQGQIDVITYVNLLLEGWDSPESDFTVLLRPTASRVLAEQRIGRIIRPRRNKVATIHEIMYGVAEGGLPQVTHMDIMEQKVIKQGYHYYQGRKSESERAANRRYAQGPTHIFEVEDFMVDPLLLQSIANLEDTPLEEIKVVCGQESIPFDWPTTHILANRFNMSLAEVEEILSNAGLLGKEEEYDNVRRVYYPPRSSNIIAEQLGLAELPEGYLTLTELTEYHRSFRQYNRVRRTTIVKALQEWGIEYGLFLRADGNVVRAYPPESKKVPPVAEGGEDEKKGTSQENASPNEENYDNVVDSLTWLKGILVDPNAIDNKVLRRKVAVAQQCLIVAIDKLGPLPANIHEKIVSEIETQQIEPSYQMKKVMEAKRLDLIGLIVVAVRALKQFQKLQNS